MLIKIKKKKPQNSVLPWVKESWRNFFPHELGSIEEEAQLYLVERLCFWSLNGLMLPFMVVSTEQILEKQPPSRIWRTGHWWLKPLFLGTRVS